MSPRLKAFYENSNQTIEKRTWRVNFAMGELIPIGFTLPFAITVFIAYFTQEQIDDDTYRMAFPAW